VGCYLAKSGLIVSYDSSNVAAQQPEECSEQQANTDESETEADDPAAGCHSFAAFEGVGSSIGTHPGFKRTRGLLILARLI
jgi:hypothetical protein